MKTRMPSDERKSVFGNKSTGVGSLSHVADWANASSTAVGRLVECVTSKGGAVRFGLSRDGGAYSVGFYYGEDRTTEYCKPTEDLDKFLEGWSEFYEGLPILKK